jgi:hypothetical protein
MTTPFHVISDNEPANKELRNPCTGNAVNRTFLLRERARDLAEEFGAKLPPADRERLREAIAAELIETSNDEYPLAKQRAAVESADRIEALERKLDERATELAKARDTTAINTEVEKRLAAQLELEKSKLAASVQDLERRWMGTVKATLGPLLGPRPAVPGEVTP